MRQTISASTSPADLLIAYDEGHLDDEQTIELFQSLIDSGQAWRLSGHIGRTAMSLIKSGACLLGPTDFVDAYGNHVPSRDQVEPGTPGSLEYVLNALPC